ncbi:carboxylesterase family protein, partial [Brevibacterium paucivorans]
MTSTSAESNQPTVTAPCGTVRGLSDGEVECYLGIPYAQPMTGAAAFQAPRPLESLPGGEFA